MARTFLRAVLGAALLGIIPFLMAAGQDDDSPNKDKIQTVLAVQSALREGRDQLQRGNFQGAVYALEREAHRCSGDKDYLSFLETAYRGYIRELQQKSRDAEAAKYVERLAALDPGSRLDRSPPVLGAQASVIQTPVKLPEMRAALDYKAVEERDPFSAANRAKPVADARSVLAQADQEFKDRHYQTAGRLYQEAHTIDPNATVACRECWAYCKLHGVVEALQPNAAPVATDDLKREVRQAMSMAPKLEDYGQKLLRNLEERVPARGAAADERIEETAKFEMRHMGTQGKWSVLETPNFRIYHNQPKEVAEKAATIAEQTRLVQSKKWYGNANERWNQPCDLYLHGTAQEYSRETNVPPQSPGHSTIQAEGEVVRSRRIDIHCDDANWPIGVLPHETTHVVLAGHYGDKAVPRWADEGTAVLAEPRDRIERHLRNLPRHREDHVLFGVGQLMEMNDYPKPQLIGPFYAQSVSLVEYLSSLKGPQAYTAFLRDSLRRDGYEAALKKHYGIQGYADLQRRWETYAFNQQSASADSPR